MYRCVGLAARDRRRPPARGRRADHIELGDRVLLDGEDVTEAIRAPEVSEAASRVAADPAVRAALVAKQQAIVADGDWVAEGRDIAHRRRARRRGQGLPHADPEERARRRAAQLGGDVEDGPARAARARRARPHAPAARRSSPRRTPCPVDTTGLTLDEVVDQVVTLAVEAQGDRA